MNKKILEEMFDEKFLKQYSGIDTIFGETGLAYDIKTFLFETIIPEVLKSVIYECDYYEDVEKIKKKAKENFGIDL